MSIAPPPYPIFNNINYNGSFFSTNTGGLTQSQANLLYLQKKNPDTATAVETFTAGINTNIVQPSSTSANLFLYTISSYALNFGTNALSIAIGSLSAIINIGGTSTITNFVGKTTSSYTLASSDNSTNIATTSWATSNFAKLNVANFWTALQTFTAGLNTSVIGTISFPSVYSLWDTANTTVNIATNTAYPVNLGGSTNTTTVNGGIVNIGTASVSTTNLNGTLTTNSPIGIGYNPAYISSGQIGYNVETIIGSNINLSFGENAIGTVTLPAGVYILAYSWRITGNNCVVRLCESWMQTSVNTVQYGNCGHLYIPNLTISDILCNTGSVVVSLASSTTVTYKIYMNYSGGTQSFLTSTLSSWSYTRIA